MRGEGARAGSHLASIPRALLWGSLLAVVALLLLLAAFVLDSTGVVPIELDSVTGYVCAVCGRCKVVRRRFGSERTSCRRSPATSFCDRFVGAHEHIWVNDHDYQKRLSVTTFGDSFAHMEIPMSAYGVSRALEMLEGTPYLEIVVKALCDVDNYYAYVARQVLVWESCQVFDPDRLPTREQLDAWWERNRQFFDVEHDARVALSNLEQINKEYSFAGYGARQTLEYHKRYGVPTKGAWVERKARWRRSVVK